ncbi:hypothetical protein RHMOL_RhmolMtG0005500 (mitochondrion) [Rhododendron molle]|nr:hypothetical protein RHMOL_RhmolMtG0005500 [Rhododendron molle]
MKPSTDSRLEWEVGLKKSLWSWEPSCFCCAPFPSPGYLVIPVVVSEAADVRSFLSDVKTLALSYLIEEVSLTSLRLLLLPEMDLEPCEEMLQAPLLLGLDLLLLEDLLLLVLDKENEVFNDPPVRTWANVAAKEELSFVEYQGVPPASSKTPEDSVSDPMEDKEHHPAQTFPSADLPKGYQTTGRVLDHNRLLPEMKAASLTCSYSTNTGHGHGNATIFHYLTVHNKRYSIMAEKNMNWPLTCIPEYTTMFLRTYSKKADSDELDNGKKWTSEEHRKKEHRKNEREADGIHYVVPTATTPATKARDTRTTKPLTN